MTSSAVTATVRLSGHVEVRRQDTFTGIIIECRCTVPVTSGRVMDDRREQKSSARQKILREASFSQCSPASANMTCPSIQLNRLSVSSDSSAQSRSSRLP